MQKSIKLALGGLLLGSLLLGCGGSGKKSSTKDVPQSVTHRSDTNGGGEMTGPGELTPYTGTYAPIEGQNKKLLAIYMLGSDLEREGDAGTTDLTELIEGYNALTPEEQKRLDIVVAFGGADKEGWRGMKIATIDDILNDGEDEEFGNMPESSYQYVAPLANMGNGSSLELFVTYIKNNYANHTTKFMDMWDHGAGYVYLLGSDDYYAAAETKDNILHDTTIKAIFEKSGLHFNLLGFDACLNGSLDAAKAVKNVTDYYMGSEETEPGHGWNYTDLITAYAQENNVTDVAKKVISSFVATEDSEGKTLSVVDTSYYQNVEDGIDQLADTLLVADTDPIIKQVLINSLSSKIEKSDGTIENDVKLRSYNVDQNGVRSAIDLYHFCTLLIQNLEAIEQSESEAHQAAMAMQQALSAYVVYSEYDSTQINSYGVAVKAIDYPYADYNNANPVTQKWADLIYKYYTIKDADNEPVEITEPATNTRLSFSNDMILPSPPNLPTPHPQLSDDAIKALTCSLDAWSEWNKKEISDAELRVRQEACLQLNGGVQKLSNQSKKSSPFMYKAETESDGDLNITITRASFEDSDDNLKDVKLIYGNMIDSEFYTTAVLETIPSYKANEYLSPAWNQMWYTVEYEQGQETAWIPMVFQGHVGNNLLYTAEIDYIGASRDYSDYEEGYKYDYAQLEIVVDSNNSLLSNTIRPYTIEESENNETIIQYEKTIGAIQVGDQIRFYAEVFDLNQTDQEPMWNTESDFLTFKQPFNLHVEELAFEDEEGKPLDYYYTMMAEDIAGHKTFTKVQLTEK